MFGAFYAGDKFSLHEGSQFSVYSADRELRAFYRTFLLGDNIYPLLGYFVPLASASSPLGICVAFAIFLIGNAGVVVGGMR
jgi:hypothetical protein